MNAQEYILNIRPGVGYAPTVKISQYDIGRPLQFHLYDGTAPLAIATGTTIKIHATKPSGLGFEEACTWSGSSASIDTTESMTQEYGIFPAELELSVGGDIIGTANFMMHIERSPHPEGTTDGVAEDLQDIYEKLDDLKEDIGDLDDLETTDKSNLVAAINEAAQSGGGGGGGSVSPYTSDTAALRTASPGSSANYSRGDHVHPMPSASDVGAIAAPSSPSSGQFLVYNGSAWVAQTVPSASGEEF